MRERYTFQHTFLPDLTCSVVFEPAIHWDQDANSIRPEKWWSRDPTTEEFRAFLPHYREWMHTVNAELSRIIDGDHTYMLQDRDPAGPRWEFWVYHANGAKECIAQEDGIFDPSLLRW